ncbi:uncharacterized protein DSM5745_07147 [Aspergillus mulundensis]|uniref:Uncharacterized protein n=1 Tax=Aspergillus mulundensis TaxID=1810919 RepID=A0A3D8RKB3_9EURO|nr:hypothetical protein DSM5745_07147 [Aspergillus mulundensis]RDW74485.1 hypothetical protein DSM5745_07147 [Aspergillus mulundensis]
MVDPKAYTEVGFVWDDWTRTQPAFAQAGLEGKRRLSITDSSVAKNPENSSSWHNESQADAVPRAETIDGETYNVTKSIRGEDALACRRCLKLLELMHKDENEGIYTFAGEMALQSAYSRVVEVVLADANLKLLPQPAGMHTEKD